VATKSGYRYDCRSGTSVVGIRRQPVFDGASLQPDPDADEKGYVGVLPMLATVPTKPAPRCCWMTRVGAPSAIRRRRVTVSLPHCHSGCESQGDTSFDRSHDFLKKLRRTDFSDDANGVRR
jgi:hypothetical protein